jgi:hypothetical protein
MDFWYENIPSGNPAIISEASYILWSIQQKTFLSDLPLIRSVRHPDRKKMCKAAPSSALIFYWGKSIFESKY